MKKIISTAAILLFAVCMAFGQTEALIIDASGNVGVGTSTPTVKLDVNGDMKADDVVAATVSGKLQSSQLDYIYAGNQVVVSHWEGTLAAGAQTAVLICAYQDWVLGRPSIPNPDPVNYKLLYYATAQVHNTNGNFPYICINGEEIIVVASWSLLPFMNVEKSKFFTSWEDFPTKDIWNGSGNGLEIRVKNFTTGSTIASFNNLSIHYVYVRNSVTIDYLLPPHQ